MLTAAVVAAAAAVSQRCRAQPMLQLNTETKITRFLNGSNVSVPLGVPAQPAVGPCRRGRALGNCRPADPRPRPADPGQRTVLFKHHGKVATRPLLPPCR